MLVPGVGWLRWRTRSGGVDGGGDIRTFDMVVYWVGALDLKHVCMMMWCMYAMCLFTAFLIIMTVAG